MAKPVATEFGCPNCGAPLRPPNLMHDGYLCPQHGEVPPLHSPLLPQPDHLATLVGAAEVPAWIPWPLPTNWVFTGIRMVGGGPIPITAVAVGLTGAALNSGPADLVIIAEQPGTGLGARYSGIISQDPDPSMLANPPATHIHAAGWPTPLWSLPTEDDRAIYVGEASGEWLWLITWPELAWSVVHDDLRLIDLRTADRITELPVGAAMPRLRFPEGN